MKFLVPTDFSENSKHAVEYAAYLAKSLGAEIILLHAWKQVPVSSEMEELSVTLGIEYFAKRSEDSLNELVKEFEKECPVFTEPVSRQGFAPEVIKSVAAELNVDLVVMGRRGLGAVGRLIIGSVSSKVFSSDVRPLLVIPDKASITQLQEIVFTTDFHHSDIEHLKVILKIAKAFGSHVNVIHFHETDVVDEVPEGLFESYEETMRKELRYAGLSFEQIECTNLHEALETFVQTKRVNLISVAGVHRSLIGQWIDPSFSKHVLTQSQAPVLVFKAFDSEDSDF